MTGLFWLTTMIMCVVAFSFVASPLREAGRHHLVIGLGVLVPVTAASMYLLFGSPGVASAGTAELSAYRSPASMPAQPSKTKVGSVSSMLEGLEQRLRDNPDDGEGWLLLAKSYKHTNRPAEAAEAYAKAAALGEYEESLEGMSSVASTTATSTVQVTGTLSMSSKAADVVQPDDIVFIFARSVGDAGAPAAVLKLPASALPVDFALDDTQSMMPNMKLSDFENVVVTARVSRGGNAMQALQGLEAKSDVIGVRDGKPLQLIIE